MRLLSVFCTTWIAIAQTSSGPSVLQKVDPEYSDLARTAAVNGSVLLQVTVAEDGKPLNPKVIRSLGYGLDEKAVEAVMRWTFRPGTKDGMPVSVKANIEVNFRLLNTGRGALGPMTFSVEAGVTPPVLTAVSLPPSYGIANVELEFTVMPSGSVADFQVNGAMAAAEEKLLLDSMKEWTFKPAMREGLAVPARGKVTYSVR